MRDALQRARLVLLAPSVALEIGVPGQRTGDVTGDLKNRRGQVVEVLINDGAASVRAQARLGELGRYASQLRSMTGGHGTFVMELSHYDVVPPALQQKIAGERKPAAEEE
jgi:elongation factor G